MRKLAITLLWLCCHGVLAEVTSSRLVNAQSEPDNWLSHGRTYAEQRHSTLNQIDKQTVDRLGLAWSFELPTRRGQEATPLVIDGTLFVTGSWSMVFALDAKSGELLWQHDPQVPRATSKFACCDAVNRGVAAWGDRVFVGTLDGRLQALQMQTGELLWSTETVPENQRYTITGAPRVIDGLVLIGNGGGEMGVRGYVSAYDAQTGELVWRFYTVPGDPALGFEQPVLEEAAKTWSGEWWRIGGGGTVWDSMAHDPQLDLVYIGVGNGSPWRRDLRSPQGGDNLFLSSIVALRPKTGEYVWHYQTTPADTWDYTATQHMILADIEWGGEPRQVLMQAPKNGFFYVLDRVDGELLSAEPFVPVNWATHVDMQTGRPVETGLDYADSAQLTQPSPLGGHNWMPMAFNPDTELVYIPAMQGLFNYGPSASYPNDDALWRTGADFSQAATPLFIAPAVENDLVRRPGIAHLLAWDPKQQKVAWKVQHAHPWNGGVLSTAGGLVFQGDATGQFSAYDAATGERLWQRPANNGIVAAPITYAIDGEQYVAVLAGWGGAMPLVAGRVNDFVKGGATGRLLVYALDANGAPPPGIVQPEMPKPPRNRALDRDIRAGFVTYARHCSACHGANVVGGGLIPDLRYLSEQKHDIFSAIVGDGVLEKAGMPGFGHFLSDADIEQVRAYVIYEANREWHRRDDANWWRALKQRFARFGGWVLAKVS
ncbi:MAG: PQQ-dependent dehydrogenase, methanol/ethanol family [Pseudomonadota bacterium]